MQGKFLIYTRVRLPDYPETVKFSLCKGRGKDVVTYFNNDESCSLSCILSAVKRNIPADNRDKGLVYISLSVHINIVAVSL